MGSLQFFSRKRRKGVNLNNLLPHELLSDILSRLPLTSLPQLKLTCKLWNSLVLDPSFSDIHLTQAVKNPGHLYTLTSYSNFYFAQKELNTTVAITLPRQVDNNDLGEDTLYDSKNKRSYAAEYASSHGLVCYCSLKAQAIYVFNPMIREHVRLPDRPFHVTLRWGFGFAPITKKYKCYCYSAQMAQEKKLVFSSAVYTLGDESWREITCAPYPMSISRQHVYCKGALYWAIPNEDVNHLFRELCSNFEPGYNVLSLDLETETFCERRVGHEHQTQQFYLTVVGETVGAVLPLYNGLKVLLLVDGDKDIWELKYSIPFRIPKGLKYMYELEFSGLWMNQELYCRERITKTTSRGYDVKCFSFSPGDNKFTALRLPIAKDVHGNEITPQLIIPHVGSLVSPINIMTAGKPHHTGLS